MKTQEQKMQFIVEKAGECWHELLELPHTRRWNEFVCDDVAEFFCKHCSAEWEETPLSHINNNYSNPSPTDLNELMRLAGKLNFHCEIDVDGNGQSQVSLHGDNLLSIRPSGQSIEGLPFAEALLNALYKACGGKDE